MYRGTTLPTTRSWFEQKNWNWNVLVGFPHLQVCHFEIFKIRGVASKQLVQDAVFSRPAHFVSFQQVQVKELMNWKRMIWVELTSREGRIRGMCAGDL